MRKSISDLLLWSGALAGGGGGGGDTPSGSEEWIGDGNTHIWISLPEGRTSPMLGIGVNGTATVNWGDGTTPDVLTGTSTESIKYTPNHKYASAGDYVITVTVDGKCGMYGSTAYGSTLLQKISSSDNSNNVYLSAVKKVELGDKVTNIKNAAFAHLYGLTSIKIPDNITSISPSAFAKCYSLLSVNIPDNVKRIDTNLFNYCHVLSRITIPNKVASIAGGAFGNCYALSSITIPDSVTMIDSSAFSYCYGLGKIRFNNTTPPTVSNSNAFTGIPTDCVISVPVGGLEAYTTATNYPSAATYTYVEE